MSRSLPALIVDLLRAYPKVTLGVAGLALVGGVALTRCAEPNIEVATFNIRFFPEGGLAQVEGAFEAIEALGVPIVAVEEITDPALFRAAAREHLGPNWEAEFGPRRVEDVVGRELQVGLLYNSERYRARDARLHTQPGPDGGLGRPALEVRLEPVAGRGPALRVFVVHLKAGGDSAKVRARQLRALQPIVVEARAGEDEVVVLGDFNSTGETDRENIEDFAAAAGLDWATEGLECTSYWKPRERDWACTGSALDHVLTSRRAREAEALGPCESEGCEPGESCPVFYDVVSDHCPVRASF